MFFSLASRNLGLHLVKGKEPILGHLYSYWSEDTQGFKEIQVLLKRSNDVIKVESLEIYKGMPTKIKDFLYLLASCVTFYV